MSFSQLLRRWSSKRAARAAARATCEAVLYFDSPMTQWARGQHNGHFAHYPGGVRIPLHEVAGADEPRYEPCTGACSGRCLPPEPDRRDIICRRPFRSPLLARAWIIGRLKGFDHDKIVGEVRPL